MRSHIQPVTLVLIFVVIKKRLDFKDVVHLKVFYADKKPLIRKACLHSSWLNTDQSFILKCQLQQQGEQQQSNEWLSAETSSLKAVSIMKVVFNDVDGIGPLAVARQLHQHYSHKLRSTGREFQRVRHAKIFKDVGEMWDLPVHEDLSRVMGLKQINIQGSSISLL